ncbi:MAG TPA: hypothetical protein VFS08_01130 [Gemmatimonadaceae bacterium]|nr:hypothetical protein [Gemmatimonadaceae bacterium]
MSKTLATALALALAAAPAAGAQSFAYAPGTRQYQLEQTIASSQEMGGAKMEMTVNTTQFITMTLGAATGGAMPVTYQVDSVTIDADAPGNPQAEAVRAQLQQQRQQIVGQRVVGAISPLGRAATLAPADSTLPNGAQLATGFRGFITAFPSADVKTGLTWTDTTTTNFDNNGITGKTVAVITHIVEGDTTVHGAKAWKVTQQGRLTVDGSGNTNGTDVAMKGSGTMSGTSFVGQDGVFLGGNTTMSQTSTVEIPAAGMAIPLTQTVTTKLTPLGH